MSSFIISEHIEEQDFETLFEINYKAFSDQPLLLVLFPGGLNPVSLLPNIARFKAGLRFGDANVVAAKAVDAQTGQIVAFAAIRMSKKNPFLPAEDNDRGFPTFINQREWLEAIFNPGGDRRQEIEELQVEGPYGCMYYCFLYRC